MEFAAAYSVGALLAGCVAGRRLGAGNSPRGRGPCHHRLGRAQTEIWGHRCGGGPVAPSRRVLRVRRVGAWKFASGVKTGGRAAALRDAPNIVDVPNEQRVGRYLRLRGGCRGQPVVAAC